MLGSTRLGCGITTFVVAVATLTSCGGSTKSSGNASKTTTSVNHELHLAEGETSGIASQLTVVAGYRYADPSANEVHQEIEALKQQLAQRGAPSDFVHAVSYHGVVADDAGQNTARTAEGGRETGFLQLREFSPPPPAGADIEQFGTEGLTKIATFNVSGTKVVEYQDPKATVDSRYMLLWLRHGVWAAFDGATRPALERWVNAYLTIPERQPNETDRLAGALVDVPGDAYANFWDASTEDFARRLFDGSPAVSIHAMVNAIGSFGTLLLATPPAGLTTQSLAASLATELKGTAQSVSFGGHPVSKVTNTDGQNGYSWISHGIAGVMLSGYPKDAEAFLQKYFA